MEEFLTIGHISALNIAIQKTLWDKKGRIILNFNDILYGQKTNGSINYQAINVKFFQIEESRNVRLTFRYSFGNQKLKAARSRATASDTEENRVKTN